MSQVITECPMCGSWEGPDDGDASKAIKALCEDCLYATGRKCPECAAEFDEPDDTAIHLVDAHHYDAESGRIWLKEKVEQNSLEAQP